MRLNVRTIRFVNTVSKQTRAKPGSRASGRMAKNLYLDPQIFAKAKSLADIRYNCSLSGLVNALLREEVTIRGGILRHKPVHRAA